MEERSKPSGDWKPYQREDAEQEARPSGDWKPYDGKDATEKAKPAGDWKPYERDKRADSDPRAESSTAQKADAGKREKSAETERPRGDEDSGERARDEDSGKRARDEDDSKEGSEHEPSTVDAMGQEKHRTVIGQRYGASRTRQFIYYGAFIAFVIAAYIGLKAATATLDKAPAKDPDQAPWSKSDATGEPLGGFEPEPSGQKGAADFQ